MDMKEIARQHLAKGLDMKIGEDIFHLLPLTVEYLPQFLGLYGKLFEIMDKPNTDGKKISEEEAMARLFSDIDSMRTIVEISKVTIKLSYPDWEDELIESFVASNYIKITIAVFELNRMGASNDDLKLIEKTKAMAKKK